MAHCKRSLFALLGGVLLLLASCSEMTSEQEIAAYAKEKGLLGHYDEHRFDNTTLRYVYDGDKDTLLLLLRREEKKEVYLLPKASMSIDALFEGDGPFVALEEGDTSLLTALQVSLTQELHAAFPMGFEGALQSRNAPDCNAETNFIRRLLCFFSQALGGSASGGTSDSSGDSTTTSSTSTSSGGGSTTAADGGGSSSTTSTDTTSTGSTDTTSTSGTGSGSGTTSGTSGTSGGASTGATGSSSSGGGASGGTSGGTSGGQTSRPIIANLSGTVWYDKNNNEQRDVNEPPLEGVTVFLDTNGNSTHDRDEPSQRTSASGAFVFSGLKTGQSYRVMEKLDLGWHNTVATEGNGQAVFGLRIINGEDTVIDKYPYMLSLQAGVDGGTPRHMCGATLISPKYALTALHCVEKLPSTILIPVPNYGLYREVRAGSSYHAKDGQVVAMRKFIPFPGANIRSSIAHDIAIMELEEPLYEVARAFMPAANDSAIDQAGTQPTIIGWGRINSGNKDIPDVLQELQITLLPEEEGWRRGTAGLTASMMRRLRAQGGKILFFHPSRAGSCNGDSGGPMLALKRFGENDVRYVQIGVTSFGTNINFFTLKRPPCVGNQSSGYTQVRAYRDWIDDNVPLETSKVIDITLNQDTEVSFGNFH